MYADMLCCVQTTINDIQQQMNEHYQKNTTLREENVELTTKLKGLIEQYELREQVSQHLVFYTVGFSATATTTAILWPFFQNSLCKPVPKTNILTHTTSVFFQDIAGNQSCQPLRFWRNDYAFWALITPLRLSIVELRFTISQLSKQHDSKHPCGAMSTRTSDVIRPFQQNKQVTFWD